MSISKKPLGLALSAAFALAGPAAVSASVFQANDLGAGYTVADAHAKTAEAKCGEGKCGAGMKDAAAKTTDAAKKADAKCGAEKKAEASCGAEKKADGSCGAKK